MKKTFGFALAGLLAIAACSDEAPVAGPGTFTGEIVGPNATEGAAVIVLIGDGIESVGSVGDSEAHASIGTEATRVVLINQIGGPLSFTVAVADTTQPLTALVEQVAGPDDELRADVTAYAVEFAR